MIKNGYYVPIIFYYKATLVTKFMDVRIETYVASEGEKIE